MEPSIGQLRKEPPVEPLPETVSAINELDPFVTDRDLLEQLRGSAAQVRAVVPDCVGLSLTLREAGVTFTLVATEAEIATLDAVQYVDGGPCVEAVVAGETIAADQSLMGEADWQLFAAATAAHGVASTLSMPLVNRGDTVGGVNLYGATPQAFDGHHDELAGILGTWAPGAVTNADLGFRTRDLARQAPGVLRDTTNLEVATGLLARRLGTDVEAARVRLQSAAIQAGVQVNRVAALVVDLLAPGGV